MALGANLEIKGISVLLAGRVGGGGGGALRSFAVVGKPVSPVEDGKASETIGVQNLEPLRTGIWGYWQLGALDSVGVLSSSHPSDDLRVNPLAAFIAAALGAGRGAEGGVKNG